MFTEKQPLFRALNPPMERTREFEGRALEHVWDALDATRKVADAVRELTHRLDRLSGK